MPREQSASRKEGNEQKSSRGFLRRRTRPKVLTRSRHFVPLAQTLIAVVVVSGAIVAAPQGALAYAGDGSGTMTASPNTNLVQGNRYTLTFTYTAASGGMSNGAVTLTVPMTWPQPTDTCFGAVTPNYVSAVIGGTYQSLITLAPTYRIVLVSGVTLSSGQTMTIKYADTICHGHGLGVTSSGGIDTWQVQQKSTSTGVLTNIPSSPTVSVLAPNGTGTLATTIGVVAAGSTGNTLPFTYTSPPGGISNGEVTLTIPTGWSAPALSGTSPGYTTSTAGSLAVAGQTVTVSGLTLSAGSTFTINYGSKGGGGPGAAAPSTVASQIWQAQEESSTVGPLANIAPVGIQVGVPPAAFLAAAGVGDSSISSPIGRAVAASDLPVNTESGELYKTATDAFIPGLGPGLTVGRAYNSANAATNGPFGYGWASNLTMALTISGGGSVATITDESGAPVTFNQSGSTWTGAAYNASTLTSVGGAWTYQRWNGHTYQFNSSGQLTSVRDRNGNTTTLGYTNGQLSSVTDASGRSLAVQWTGTNVTKITDPLQQTVQFGYDGSGNLASFTNQANVMTHYTYDSHHNLLTIQDADGNYTTITYSSSTPYKVCWILVGTSSNGCSSPPTGSVTVSYSSPGANQTAAQVVDPSGHSTLFTYDHGLMIQKIQAYATALAAATAYSYDATTLGLTLQFDPNGAATSIQRDGLGNILSRSVSNHLVADSFNSPLTSTTTYTYNSLNEPLTIVSPDGNVPGCNCASSYTTSNSYDANGNLLTTIDPVGNVVTNTYNSVGERCWTYSGSSTNTCALAPTGSSTFVYDTYGDVLSSTDGLGDQTTHSYDILGRQSTTVAADGNVSGCGCTAAYTTTYAYNPLSQQCWSFVGASSNACSVPPSGATVFAYDNNGNALTTTDPAGDVKTTAYDTHNRVCWTYNGSASPTCSAPPTGADIKSYALNGQLATETNPGGTVTTNTYNALNQLCWSVVGTSTNSCTSPPSGATLYVYDPNNNLLSTTDPSGIVTTTAYAADGLACWSYVGPPTPMGHAICTNFNQVTGGTATYYDAAGNVLQAIQPDGALTSFAYNGDAQKCWSDPFWDLSGVCSTPPDPGFDTIFAYNAAGDQTSTTYPSGAVVTQAFNVARQLCWTYSGVSSNACSSPPAGATTYAYDANGLKVTRTDATGTTRWIYDNRGNETSMTSASGVTYGYDAAGNQTSITYPGGAIVVTNAYDARRQVCWTSVGSTVSTNPCASPPAGATTYAYDNNGNLKTAVLPNGVTNSWNYDATGAVSSISDKKGSTTVFAATYTRSSAELITQDTSQTSGKQYYRFTPQNQLCYAGSSNSSSCSTPPPSSYAYTMDPSGNPIMNNGVTQAFNVSNELCWTVQGASSNSCASPPPGAQTYVYDANGRRASVQPPSGLAMCFSYDSNSELTLVQTGTGTSCSSPSTVASYTYNGDGLRATKAVGSTTTAYVWDDTSSLALLLQESSGSNTTSYVYGPTGQPLAEVLSTGTYYYSQDALNSTRAMTDASGAVKSTYTYDPYGNLASSTGSIQSHLLYDAQYQDGETGFYYLRARYYDPVTTQFLTIDPLVAQTLSPYTYTNGDPVDNADPTGQWQFSATAYAAWKDVAFIPLTSMWLTMQWNTNGWRVTAASGYVMVEAHDGGWAFGRWQLDYSNFGIWWSGGCLWSCGSLSLTSKAGFYDPGGAFNWWGDWYNTVSATIIVFGPRWTYRVGLWLREDLLFRRTWGAWWGSPWNAPWWAHP